MKEAKGDQNKALDSLPSLNQIRTERSSSSPSFALHSLSLSLSLPYLISSARSLSLSTKTEMFVTLLI
jgi:hypothetical protein